MEKLALNYANLTTALAVQTPTSMSPIQSIRTNNNFRPRQDKRNRACYRCGEQGHFARECLSETPRRASTPENNRSHSNINYVDVEDDEEVYVIGERNRSRTRSTINERAQNARSESQKERELRFNTNRNMGNKSTGGQTTEGTPLLFLK